MKLNNFFVLSLRLDYKLINKYLSKCVYPKFVIRNTLKSGAFFGYLDTYSELYQSTFKKYYKFIKMRFCKVGFSLMKKICFYTNYNLLLFFAGAGYKKVARSLAGALLTRLNVWSQVNHLVYVYKACRGGLIALSKGVCGFLPLLYILLFNKNFIGHIRHKKYILFNCFSGLNLTSYRLESFNFLKHKIIHNFNKSSKKLRQFYFLKLKYVFIQYTTLIKFWCTFFLALFSKIKAKQFLILNLIFFKILNVCL
jgi:hypothetical protein